MVWAEALNMAGVSATSELRKTENIWFPPNICAALVALLPPLDLEPIPSEQPSTTQNSLPLPKVSTGSELVGDQGKEAKVASSDETDQRWSSAKREG